VPPRSHRSLIAASTAFYHYFVLKQVGLSSKWLIFSLTSYLAQEVIAESVIVIGSLLRRRVEDSIDMIAKMGNLVCDITSPLAKSCILSLIGENCEHLERVAPDVFRRFAKSFREEVKIAEDQF
jgi:hypothetical protein